MEKKLRRKCSLSYRCLLRSKKSAFFIADKDTEETSFKWATININIIGEVYETGLTLNDTLELGRQD